EQGNEALGRDDAVGVDDEFAYLVPVGLAIESDAEPAAMTDIGRPEVAPRILGDQLTLRAGWGRTPEVGELVVVMAVDHESDEHTLAAYEPGRRPMTEPLSGLRQPETDPAHPLHHVHTPSLPGGAVRFGPLPRPCGGVCASAAGRPSGR